MSEPYVVRGDTDESSIARHNETPHCSICYATGADVWGIEGYQLVLCQRCRITWRRSMGYPDFSE
jgi:hypothetical protein